ncbi:MAG: glycosyltransferase family 9 protein [Myxococcota bacterium]
MNLGTKRALDHWLGSFCLLAMSPLVRGLGALLRRSHRRLPVRAIVILKFQGMGSVAIAAPAIARLRASQPSARLVFWGTRPTCALAQELALFDELIVLEESSLWAAARSALRGLRRLHRLRPDWCLDLEVYSKLSVVLCTLSAGRNRAGFAVDSVRLRRMNHTHLVLFNRHHYLGHAYGRLLGLVAEAGAPGDLDPGAPGESSRITLHSTPAPCDGDYVVVNPNAGELSLERRWPIDAFARLLRELLARDPQRKVVLVGSGNGEAEYCRELARDPRVLDRVDRLSLSELIGCIAGARLVVSNDSAPLHLALLGDVPVVALFGPTDPLTYVMRQRPRTRVHYSGIYCSPCIHYWAEPPCRGWNACMRSIRVEDVLASCLELLGPEPPDDLRVIGAPASDFASDASYYAGLVYAKDRELPG